MFTADLFSIFNKYPEIQIIISSRNEGNMRVHYDLKKDSKTLKNRERFLKQIKLTSKMVASAKLAHEDKVKLINENDLGKFVKGYDALITNKPRFYLSITAADCLPIFIYDPQSKAVALIHAGWKGLVKGIVPKTITALVKEFDSKPENLIVGIGPAIGPCHFQVQNDVLNQLSQYQTAYVKRNGSDYLNLKKIAAIQLQNAGVKKDHLEISPLCTFDRKDKFFSYRRDRSKPLETMLMLIGIKK